MSVFEPPSLKLGAVLWRKLSPVDWGRTGQAREKSHCSHRPVI